MQRQKQLPDVKGNMVVNRSNVSLLSQSPNVSRSWSARESRVRAEHRTENRLTRSYGDQDQEKRVLEWCQKNNINLVRRLPKLDPNVLTTKGVNTEKYLKVVDEPPIFQKKTQQKPPKVEKLKTTQPVQDFCQYCQRELAPTLGSRRPQTFFTSPYDCEHCGASNDIDDYASRMSTPDSENISESVTDTIRRGDPKLVIDHRDFPEKHDNFQNASVVDIEEPEVEDDFEMDIMWRDDTEEYRRYLENMRLEEAEIDTLRLYDEPTQKPAFLTEVNSEEDKPVPIKMAWDVEENANIAFVTRSVVSTTRDIPRNRSSFPELSEISEESQFGSETSQSALEKSRNVSEGTEHISEKSRNVSEKSTNVSEKPKDKSQRPRPSGTSSFQEKDPASGIKVHVRSRTAPGVSRNYKNEEYRRPVPRINEPYGDKDIEILEPSKNTDNEEEPNIYNTMESPVANNSVGLSRVALMRLTRQSRSRNRGARASSGGARPKTMKDQVPRTRSHDPSTLTKQYSDN